MVGQQGSRRKDTRRQVRMRARDVLRDLTGLKRTRGCGAVPVATSVGLMKGTHSAGLAGLLTCGSTWACPVCAAKIAEHRRQDANALLLAHRARGGRAMLLTLTMRHRRGQSLTELWDALSLAWKRVQGHRVWREHVKPDASGYFRVVEVTHGDKGWHVHLHVIVLVDPSVDSSDLPALRDRWESLIVERWSTALTTLGYSSVPAAQRLQLLTGDPSESLADYFAKATYEIARSDLKDARFGNRTPFEVLRNLVDAVTASGGDLDDPAVRRDLAIWRTWEHGSRGRKQWGFSRGLREDLAADVPQLEDEQIVELDQGGERVVSFTNSVWSLRLRRDPALVCKLLDVIEVSQTLAEARTRVRQLLDARFIEYLMPDDLPGHAPSRLRAAS